MMTRCFATANVAGHTSKPNLYWEAVAYLSSKGNMTKTHQVTVELPVEDPIGNDIELEITLTIKDGVVQLMSAKQVKNWSEEEIFRNN